MMISPQKMTASQFAALSRSDQLDVLRRSTSRQKLRQLLDAVDGDELLALLPPQDVYLLARELGPDQIPELLGMATAEQWTAFVDFDCWDGDRFDPRAARNWLAVLLEGEESQVAAILTGLNFELLVLMLQQEVQIVSGPEDIENEQERGEMLRRDGGFILEYRDEEGAKLYGALLDILFRYHPDFFRYLLEASRAEGESLLEENVYQQRGERLLDQGFPDAHAAQAVYAWLDPESFAVGTGRKIPLGGSEAGAAPGAILQLASPGGLLATVLNAGIDAETSWELASLVNKVLMADRIDLGEFDQVRDTVARAFTTLNLALEYLAGSDAEAAGRCLHKAYAEQLFRLGFSLTLQLQRRARAVRQSAVGPYLDSRFRLLIEPLLLRRPQFPEAVVRSEQGDVRPFGNLREIRLVEEWLDRIEVQRRLFEEHFAFSLPTPAAWELAGCHPDDGSALTLSTIFLTALANRLLDRPFAPVPLAAADLAELHALVSRHGQLEAGLRRRTLDWLETLEADAGQFGEFCLALWEEEFCTVAANDLDPRYIGGLIVRER